MNSGEVKPNQATNTMKITPTPIQEIVIRAHAAGKLTDAELAVIFAGPNATDPLAPCAPEELARRICEEAVAVFDTYRAL